MTVPVWVLVLGFFGLPVVGFLLCALMVAAKTGDQQ